MLLDIRPLRHNRAFRLLFASQFVSALGTMVSYVAVPWQVYQRTHSNAQVGLLGLVQLVPVVVCGLLGGAVADRVDRKRLLIGSEALMALCLAGLLTNTLAASPSLLVIYVLVAVLQGASGFHRPALEALTQKLARRDEYAAVAALSSIRGTFGMVVGPAIAGVLLAGGGAVGAYLFDLVTFIVALLLLARIPRAQVDAPARSDESAHLLTDRGTIWNETIPNEMRGRLAGIEMISYLTGPLIGNARAGFTAEVSGLSVAIWSGGAVCVVAVAATGFLLPRFWGYLGGSIRS